MTTQAHDNNNNILKKGKIRTESFQFISFCNFNFLTLNFYASGQWNFA